MKRRSSNNHHEDDGRVSPRSPVSLERSLMLLLTSSTRSDEMSHHHHHQGNDNDDEYDVNNNDDSDSKEHHHHHLLQSSSAQKRHRIYTWKRSILILFFLLLCVYDRAVVVIMTMMNNNHRPRRQGGGQEQRLDRGGNLSSTAAAAAMPCHDANTTTTTVTTTATTTRSNNNHFFLSSLPVGRTWEERSSLSSSSSSSAKQQPAVLQSICPSCWETRDTMTQQPCAAIIMLLLWHEQQQPQQVPKQRQRQRRFSIYEHNQQLLQAVTSNLSSSSLSLSCQTACQQVSCQYWRQDAAGPIERYSQSHSLLSIPHQHRLPPEAVDNLEQYFMQQQQQKQHHGVDAHSPSNLYLFAYNPTLVVLPQRLRKVTRSFFFPNDDKNDDDNNDAGDDGAVYLASYRVTHFQYCFAASKKANAYLYGHNNQEQQQPQQPHSIHDNDIPIMMDDGLVALALLRADLSLVADITVNVSDILRMQDPRLFVFDDTIYLASYEAIVPIDLVKSGSVATATTAASVISDDDDDDDNENYVILHNYWNHTTKDNGATPPPPFAIRIRRQPSCAVSSPGGKNFNYFSIASSNDNNNINDTAQSQVWVETNPLQPRRLERVDLQQPCRHHHQSLNKPEPIAVLEEMKHAVKPSFETYDTLLFALQQQEEREHPRLQGPRRRQQHSFLPYSAERGTACCVPITTSTGQTWMVGISHTKSFQDDTRTVTGRQYFSRLYAFDNQHPSHIVAMSGTFCMGFPSARDIAQNYLHAAAVHQPFVVGQALQCPKITFVSGITEAADDPSKVIISYGINDCTGRMVIVDKSDLLAMLINPESRMNGTITQ